MSIMKKYPLAIIGAGMAGLTASLYASRYGLSHALIGAVPGGKGLDAILVENYPGFEQISGVELMQRVKKQVLSYHPDFYQEKVEEIREEKNEFKLVLSSQKKIKANFLILALGTKRRKLNVEGEKEFLGKGVHFCAACDGYFYKDKKVLVVGGGNAGVTAALMLSDIAKKIYLLEAADKLRATPIWQKRIKQKRNVNIVLANAVKAFKGGERLEKVSLVHPYSGSKELKVDGVFVEIGSIPNNRLAKKLGLDLDQRGYIKVKDNQQTSHPKIYAAGDITTGSNYFQQLLISASEGAIAVDSLYRSSFASF